MNDSSFFSRHSDAIAIVGVNLAIFAIMVALLISNINSVAMVNARVDACQARSDAIQLMIYDFLKDLKKG